MSPPDTKPPRITFQRTLPPSSMRAVTAPVHTTPTPVSHAPIMPTSPEDIYVSPEEAVDATGASRLLGWQRFLTVPPALRTWLTNTMIHIEMILQFLSNLTADELTPGLQAQLKGLSKSLGNMVTNFQSPYMNNGLDPLLEVQRLQDDIFREGGGEAARSTINMTDANSRDKSGELGDLFKNVIVNWLHDIYGRRQVSLNPEGTTFMVIDIPRHRVVDNASRQITEIIQGMEASGRTLPEGFVPRVVSMFMKFSEGDIDLTELTSDLDQQRVQEIGPVKAIVESKNKEKILALQQRIIAYIERSLRIMAVANTIAEKASEAGNYDLIERIGIRLIQSGTLVFEAPDIGRLFEDPYFAEKYRIGEGYVPATRYFSLPYELFGSGSNEIPFLAGPEDAHLSGALSYLFRLLPRHGHEYGRIDHLKRDDDPGGALQILQAALLAAADAQTRGEKEAAVEAIHAAIPAFAKILELGRSARANTRNEAVAKFEQPVILHDRTERIDSYFFENMALRPEENVHLAIIEVDDLKAFLKKYGVSESDAYFWTIPDAFIWAAGVMNIEMNPQFITQVGGDLMAIALPTVDKDGNPVDINKFMKKVRDWIYFTYSNMPFQAEGKVQVPNGGGTDRYDRIPLWRVSGKVLPFLNVPTGGAPYERTLTISAIGTTVRTPRTEEDRAHLREAIFNMGKIVQYLKGITAPNKDAYAFVPAENILKTPPQAITGFNVEERRGGLEGQLAGIWGDVWDRLSEGIRTYFVDQLRPTYETAAGPFWPVPNLIAGSMPAEITGVHDEEITSAEDVTSEEITSVEEEQLIGEDFSEDYLPIPEWPIVPAIEPFPVAI